MVLLNCGVAKSGMLRSAGTTSTERLAFSRSLGRAFNGRARGQQPRRDATPVWVCAAMKCYMYPQDLQALPATHGDSYNA
jgi:hypothetical protein